MIETLKTIAILGIYPAFALSIVVIIFLARLYNKVSAQPRVTKITHDKVYLTTLPPTVVEGMKFVSPGANGILAVVLQPRHQSVDLEEVHNQWRERHRPKFPEGFEAFEKAFEEVVPQVVRKHNELRYQSNDARRSYNFVYWNPKGTMLAPSGGKLMVEGMKVIITTKVPKGEFVITETPAFN